MADKKENIMPQALEDDEAKAVFGGMFTPGKEKSAFVTPEDLEKLQEMLREQPPDIRTL